LYIIDFVDCSDEAEANKPLKEKLYDTLPRSMKSEVLVRVRDEDPDIQKQRQELTRAKSPIQLSQISSFSGMISKRSGDEADRAGEPTPPPRRFRKQDLYESLPASLKMEVLVGSKFEANDEILQQRQELIRSKSPAQLSEMRGLEDFPIPTCVENLTKKKMPDLPSLEKGYVSLVVMSPLVYIFDITCTCFVKMPMLECCHLDRLNGQAKQLLFTYNLLIY
jgi:hypothetical protein